MKKLSPRKTARKAKKAVSRAKAVLKKAVSMGEHHKPLSHENEAGWKSFMFQYHDEGDGGNGDEHVMIPKSAADRALMQELRRLKDAGVLNEKEFSGQAKRVKKRPPKKKE